MPDFRYPQTCALARATEILGERWTPLVIRELLSGPQRFSDLRGRLAGVSPSVLAERLERLEARGVVRRRELPPPAASTVYDLTETGRGLEPAIVELTRWGARFLLPPVEGDQFEPAWVPGGLKAMASRGATPARALQIRVRDGEREHVVFVTGGRRGTRVSLEPRRTEATLCANAFDVFALAAGMLPVDVALEDGRIEVEGDPEAACALPDLFDPEILEPPTQET